MIFEHKPYLRCVAFRSDVTPDFDVYPCNIPAVQALEQIEFHPDVTFSVDENGAGKLTVLEAIALALGFGAEDGMRNLHLRTTEQASSLLHDMLRPIGGISPRDGYFHAGREPLQRSPPRWMKSVI